MGEKQNDREIGDHARAMGKALLDLVAHNYREEEWHDIWEAFTEVCKAGLESYDTHARRMAQRIEPGRN